MKTGNQIVNQIGNRSIIEFKSFIKFKFNENWKLNWKLNWKPNWKSN